MNVPRTEIGRPSLAVKAFGITDTGRVRPSNEDQFLIAELTKTMRIWHASLPDAKAQFGDERGHLFLVADGMGGHQGGEEASALAVLAIQQFTLNALKWFFESKQEAQSVLAQFQAALRQADVRIREQADSGNPTVAADPDSRAAQIYREIARKAAVKIAEKQQDYSAAFPKIVIQNT